MDDDPGFSDDGRDLCRYRCESQAYQALQAHGICDQGVVHCFYGVFEDIDPHLLGSSLEAFEDDKKQPCAILLEYLSGSKSFSSHGVFCPELLERAMASLEKIHAAGVIHNDSYPKNILVVSGGKGCPRQRVVWIDFDVSIVFSADIAGQILDLDLDGEAEWEMRVFKSRVRKMVRIFDYFSLFLFCFLTDWVRSKNNTHLHYHSNDLNTL